MRYVVKEGLPRFAFFLLDVFIQSLYIMFMETIISKKAGISYPPKEDPSGATWIIAFDINDKLYSLYKYAMNPKNAGILNGETPIDYAGNCTVAVNNEIYNVLKSYGFDKQLQNSLVFNNLQDATGAFKAVSSGLAKSWAKYFIDRIHLFQVDPNSNAAELLNKNQIIAKEDRPAWFTDAVFDFITADDGSGSN